MARQEFTQDKIKELLYYNIDTGIFTWKERPVTRKGKGCNPFNAKFAKKEAGNINKEGYVKIVIYKYEYKAHRLVWLYVYGYNPKHQIDHINGIRYDNRIINLRESNNSQNQENQRKAMTNNKSTGLLGAYISKDQKRVKKYIAKIGCNGKIKTLGHFSTAIEAHDAYIQAKRQYHKYGML